MSIDLVSMAECDLVLASANVIAVRVEELIFIALNEIVF